MGERGHDEEVDSSKKKRNPIYDQNGGKMAKIDTLFMTKTAEKEIPFGAAHAYIAYIRDYPRGWWVISTYRSLISQSDYVSSGTKTSQFQT